MSNQVTLVNQNQLQENNRNIINWTDAEIQRIKNQICAGFSDGDFQTFLYIAKRRRLDPFAKQIFPVNREGKMVIQTGIDGFRVTAERTGKYRGQTCPEWCGKDGVWRDVWIEEDYPAAARVGVWVEGNKEPIYAVAVFRTYVQTKKNGDINHFWQKMPDLMLSKCAEALALRKAFPEDLSGLYTEDEMGQASPETLEKPKEVKDVASTTEPPKVVPVPKPQPGPAPQMPPAAAQGGDYRKPSEAQLKRLFAISKTAHIDIEHVRDYVEWKYKKDSTKELSIAEYNETCDLMASGEFYNALDALNGKQPVMAEEGNFSEEMPAGFYDQNDPGYVK